MLDDRNPSEWMARKVLRGAHGLGCDGRESVVCVFLLERNQHGAAEGAAGYAVHDYLVVLGARGGGVWACIPDGV